MKRSHVILGFIATAATLFSANKIGLFTSYSDMSNDVEEMLAEARKINHQMAPKLHAPTQQAMTLPYQAETPDLEELEQDNVFGLYYQNKGDTMVVLYSRNYFFPDNQSDTLYLNVTVNDDAPTDPILAPSLSTIQMDLDAARRMVVRNVINPHKDNPSHMDITQYRYPLSDLFLIPYKNQ